MKHQIKTMMAVATMFCATIPLVGVTPSYTFNLRPAVIHPSTDNEKGEGGKHIPPRPVQCTIDPTDGIQFVGMEKPDILSFEVYDLSGACVAVFGDEAPFLEYIFVQKGEYRIRLITADRAYVGFIGL